MEQESFSAEELLPDEPAAVVRPPSGEMAPLLRALIAQYAATGLPPAYLPKDEIPNDERKASHE